MLQKKIWRFAKKVSMLKTDEKRNTTISHLLRSRIWDMVVFLFSVFWLQKGEKAEDYCLLGRYIIQKIIFSL